RVRVPRSAQGRLLACTRRGWFRRGAIPGRVAGGVGPPGPAVRGLLLAVPLAHSGSSACVVTWWPSVPRWRCWLVTPRRRTRPCPGLGHVISFPVLTRCRAAQSYRGRAGELVVRPRRALDVPD